VVDEQSPNGPQPAAPSSKVNLEMRSPGVKGVPKAGRQDFSITLPGLATVCVTLADGNADRGSMGFPTLLQPHTALVFTHELPPPPPL
jgi:hypothetical protein